MDEDYQLALLLQREFNNEVPEIITDQKGKENRRSSSKSTHSLVDPQWEFIDPTPDIHALFIQFNDRFFWGKLHGVEVRWSPRMTSCAGVCVYQGRSGFCSVRLSLPLLKLRPRKDLVETLLHEMIHAFLFVTKNNRDRDGHGPEFHKHMNRINQEAGTRITVYHSFHDEVRLYQQHWWRCNGPCQHRPPFFGMVRRSMNRAPGPYDQWWAQHEATCGGKYIKVREPENTKNKTSDSKLKGQTTGSKGDIRSFFPGPQSKPSGHIEKPTNLPLNQSSSANKFNNFSSTNFGSKTSSNSIPSGSTSTNKPNIFRKPIMNNVHGFGSEKTAEIVAKPSVTPSVNNVVGFGDLTCQGKPKMKTSSQPTGKGHILGGKAKPPFQSKGGSNSGILNRGSGTLVVSGSKTKANEASTASDSSASSATIQSNSVKVFSGTGHVLGKGPSNQAGTSSHGYCQPAERLNPFQKNLPVFTNADEDGTQRKRKSLDSQLTADSSLVTCPVCNDQVLASVINSHLDDCVSDTPKSALNPKLPKTESNNDDVIVLSDTEDDIVKEHGSIQSTRSEVDCPCCNKKIQKTELESHLSLCVSSSFAEDEIEIVSENIGDKAECPICGCSIPSRDMDKHLDNCASCSIQDLSGVFDEDFSDEEEDAAVGSSPKKVSESGEHLFPCPCCLILIETSKMNEHLDQCVVL